jgi:hypothetical protein
MSFPEARRPVLWTMLLLLGLSCAETPRQEEHVSCQGGRTQTECVPPGQLIQGSKLPGTFHRNGCQVREEVSNSCCQKAQTGPTMTDGQCCYVFCAGSCC